MDQYHGTTILSVRRGESVAMGGDGQVTLGNIVVKASARKVRRIHQGKILAGFAGGTADAFTLFERFEAIMDRMDLDPAQSYLYSDSIADIPLFETVGNPVVVNPKAPFREVAERRGWEVVAWSERGRPGETEAGDIADEWGSWGG